MRNPPSSAPTTSVRVRRQVAALLEQLVEPLELALVVAEDERVGRPAPAGRAAG